MGLKSFNPYTASRRFITVVDKSHITKQEPEKALLEPKKRSGGRNNHGEIVIWHRGEGSDILPGNALQFKHIPPGTMVHNLELYPGRGGQVVRSAGGSAQLLSKEGDLALVKLPSGEVRKFSVDCMATVGQVGNLDHENETFGKAGRTRWRGIRPTVRGVAMNPVDHPHGGGEGKVKGNHPQTPWAFPTLGKKTRHNKRTDKHIVERRK